eukprot:4756604-Pleurochrysis_carterae.AAC.1
MKARYFEDARDPPARAAARPMGAGERTQASVRASARASARERLRGAPASRQPEPHPARAPVIGQTKQHAPAASHARSESGAAIPASLHANSVSA